MAAEPTGEWHEPSSATSDEGGSSSSDESSKSYEEVLTPRPKKKGKTEEELDSTYMPEKTGPSTRNSRTPAQDDEGRVSK
jgi:hypothetical protein